MGPVLLHKKIGKTDYRLSLLPIGGYCQMKGEKDFAQAIEEGLGYVPGNKDSLYGTHPIKRALIGFAGPFFNLLFVFFASTAIMMIGYSYWTRSATIKIPEDPSFASPARDAGIKSGDTITKIAGVQISDFSDIYEQVALRGDEDIEVEVTRSSGDGKQETLTFNVRTLLNKKEGNGILGVMADGEEIEKVIPPTSLFPAIKGGFFETGRILKQTIKSLGILFKGVDITNAVSGPARISSMLGESARDGFAEGLKTGWVVVLQFMSLISVSLFIMNLLPIPILDGGLILFALVQTVTKKQIPPRIQYKIQIAGFAIIMFLFLIGLGGDIKYFIGKAGGAK